MDHIATSLKITRPKQTVHRTPEGEKISIILVKLNASRIADGYEPMRFGRLAKMLKEWNVQLLSVVIANCDEAESTGFPWSIKFWLEYKKRKPLKQSKIKL